MVGWAWMVLPELNVIPQTEYDFVGWSIFVIGGFFVVYSYLKKPRKIENKII